MRILTLKEYSDNVNKSVELFHINDIDKPNEEELLLLYICHIFEYMYNNNDDALYITDVYIILRFYDKIINMLTYNDNVDWESFWMSSSTEVVAYVTDSELTRLTEYMTIYEDMILNIVSNDKNFGYITKYDKELSTLFYYKFIKSYIKLFAYINNISTDDEEYS